MSKDQGRFERLDAAIKRLGLSNRDAAVLLDVTPAMICRYRAKGISLHRDKDRLRNAAKAIKQLRAWFTPSALKELSPAERFEHVIAALQEVTPDTHPIHTEKRLF